MSHWYKADGTKAYTVTGKNGNERPTTVRDARALNLLPSVTTILAYKAKPELDSWKQRQAVLSALTLKRLDNETDDDYISRILNDSKEQSRAAAEKGSQVHAYIEAVISNLPSQNTLEVPQDIKEGIDLWLGKAQLKGRSEVVLFDGFKAGTCDFIDDLNGIIIDFKTKQTTKDEKIKPYDDWMMQLAAYRQMLTYSYDGKQFKCQNIVISTTEPGRIEVIEHDEEDMKYALEEFNHIYQAFKTCKRL